MSATRHAVIKQILLEAMDRQGPEREEFLSRQCRGDVDLRREVEELLAAEDSDDFLERPLFRVSSAVDVEPMAGHKLGPYRLVGVVGRGGMGAVYSAEREDGEFTRQVAIKVMRRGLHSEELLAQFRRERQILASLAHPNIAMLLDGGATEDGVPYFVMEYIAGQSIDEWCQAHQLTQEQRLKLFLPVCSAIAHAHRNMVVHGDITPANILITSEGVPKLLDFGIARLMG
ncbi:MAG: serine/threonine protein kinase, partial [Bryobacterales bacterium]|nr:serine/threonine protein kinase [Bryobacterales bacterium]